MDKPGYYADTIKAQIDMTEALEYYGVTFNRAGFASCPFHSENTASFKIKGNYGHCFGCGWNGDVIKFVMELFRVDFNGAVVKLNTDFSCGLILDRRPTLREQREIEERRRAIMAERQRRADAKEAWSAEYNSLMDRWSMYDRIRMNWTPAPGADKLHPIFTRALDKLQYLEYLLLDMPLEPT
jgi:hypothetical protein